MIRPSANLMRRLSRRLLILSVLSIMGLGSLGYASVAAYPSPNASSQIKSLQITEIKLGGTNTNPSEYITIYNGNDTAMNVTGWTVEYIKEASKSKMDPQYCSETDWKVHAASGTVNTMMLSPGTISPKGSLTVPISMNDVSGGSVHIIDATHGIHDMVGWGSVSSAAMCSTNSQAAIPNNGSSLQRYVNCDASTPIDTYNDAEDLSVSNAPAPGLWTGPILASCQNVVTTPVTDSTTPPVSNEPPATPPAANGLTCEGVIISEVLPNPGGIDTGHEFIELHNPTDEAISLNGCSLQTSNSTTKTYALPNITLQPGTYQAFSDSQTGLTLPNAAGGSVWLLNGSNEISSIGYIADLTDDVSWALVDGTWQPTYTPTPGTANVWTPLAPCPAGQERNASTNRCVDMVVSNSSSNTNASAATTAASACPAGQSRNPVTNRCRKDATATSPAACAVGQERNPDTNRCRAIAAATAVGSAAAACKAGQERNPVTNRCKAVASTAAAKACPTGQERNADTNRCRKMTAGAASSKATLNDVKDVKTGGTGNTVRWGVALLALAGALGYGLYEWRQEVIRFINQRFGRKLAKLPLLKSTTLATG